MKQIIVCLLVSLTSLASSSPIGPSNGQTLFTVPTTTSQLISLQQDSVLALSLPDRLQLDAHINSLPEPRRVRISNGQEHQITEGYKSLLTLNSIPFMDITDEVHYLQTQDKIPFPDTLAHTKSYLRSVFDHIDTARMQSFLTKFTAFRTRYYRSSTGAQSQQFLLATLQAIARSNKKVDVKFTEFKHPVSYSSLYSSKRFLDVCALSVTVGTKFNHRSI